MWWNFTCFRKKFFSVSISPHPHQLERCSYKVRLLLGRSFSTSTLRYLNLYLFSRIFLMAIDGRPGPSQFPMLFLSILPWIFLLLILCLAQNPSTKLVVSIFFFNSFCSTFFFSISFFHFFQINYKFLYLKSFNNFSIIIYF